jgi:transposase
LAFDCCLFGSLPEAERAGDDREFGCHQKHAALQAHSPWTREPGPGEAAHWEPHWGAAVREVEAERDEAAETKPQDRTCRKIAALRCIRGLGENFSAVLTREVFYRSFDNRRQIASYVGITPMPYQSGGMDRDRRISRAGNPRARTTMIQLAWLWLRYQPGSELAVWFRKRVGALTGRTRRIAIVAMARKLLIALWRYVETGVVPAGAEIRAVA